MCDTISDTVIKCELLNLDYLNTGDQTTDDCGYTPVVDPMVKCENSDSDVGSECERQSSDNNKPVHRKYHTTKAILAIEHIEEDIDGNDLIKALRAQNSYRNKIIGYRCKWSDCGFVNRLLKKVETHVRTKHTKHKLIKCHLCETRCFSKESLKQHKADAHSNRVFACDYPECTYVSNRNQNLQYHVNCHYKPFLCDWPDCGQRFSRNHGLSCHKKGVHLKQYRFRCDWPGCDKVYSNRNTRNDHKAVHTGKRFPCIWPGCEFIANSRSNLKNHKKRVHLNISRRKPSDNISKKRISTLDRKFVCNWPECGKSFAKKWNLDKHLRVHSGERPYKCEWPDCKRTFAEHGNMVKHLRTHNKVKHQK